MATEEFYIFLPRHPLPANSATEPLPPGIADCPMELSDASGVRRSSVILVVAPELGTRPSPPASRLRFFQRRLAQVVDFWVPTTRKLLKSLPEVRLRLSLPSSRLAVQGLLPKSKDNIDRGIHFDRLAVELGRLVPPLFHGIHCRFHQQRRPGNVLQFLNGPVFTNDGV